MRRVIIAIALFGVSLTASAAQKTFDATYVATIANVPAGVKELKVWLPLPTTRGWQKISELQIGSSYVWVRKSDPEFGNDYAVTTIKNPAAGDVAIRVRFKVTRQDANSESPAEKDLKRVMRTDRLVKLTPEVRKLAQELTTGIKQPIDQARAIFDHVAKSGAADCSEWQAQFLALARAKEIPARFVSGFPLKAGDGVTNTQQCWAEFYVGRKGWIPVEGTTFGSLDANRVELTVGRDLRLDPRPAESIEAFVYPYAEADGKGMTGTVTIQFRQN